MTISRAFVGAGQLTTHLFELICLFVKDFLGLQAWSVESVAKSRGGSFTQGFKLSRNRTALSWVRD